MQLLTRCERHFFKELPVAELVSIGSPRTDYGATTVAQTLRVLLQGQTASGTLGPGGKLPPERELAGQLPRAARSAAR
jgi:hypothetical protein